MCAMAIIVRLLERVPIPSLNPKSVHIANIVRMVMLEQCWWAGVHSNNNTGTIPHSHTPLANCLTICAPLSLSLCLSFNVSVSILMLRGEGSSLSLLLHVNHSLLQLHSHFTPYFLHLVYTYVYHMLFSFWLAWWLCLSACVLSCVLLVGHPPSLSYQQHLLC